MCPYNDKCSFCPIGIGAKSMLPLTCKVRMAEEKTSKN